MTAPGPSDDRKEELEEEEETRFDSTRLLILKLERWHGFLISHGPTHRHIVVGILCNDIWWISG